MTMTMTMTMSEMTTAKRSIEAMVVACELNDDTIRMIQRRRKSGREARMSTAMLTMDMMDEFRVQAWTTHAHHTASTTHARTFSHPNRPECTGDAVEPRKYEHHSPEEPPRTSGHAEDAESAEHSVPPAPHGSESSHPRRS